MTRREENEKAEVQVLADRARAAVSALARRVKVLTEKGDRAAEKAEQFYKAAGIHIRQIKEESLGNWETIVREQCNIGRSRADELMAIADGKTTLEKVRASTNERQKIHKAKSQSVITDGSRILPPTNYSKVPFRVASPNPPKSVSRIARPTWLASMSRKQSMRLIGASLV